MGPTYQGGEERHSKDAVGLPHTKMVVANQLEILIIDKQQKTPVVVHVPSPVMGWPHILLISKKEEVKLEKYQRLREELQRACKVKATVVLVVIEALGAVTPQTGDMAPKQPGGRTGILIQRCRDLGVDLL